VSIGFTLDRTGRQVSPSKGYAVGVAGHANLASAFKHASPEQYIGYWLDDRTDKEYIDVVEIIDALPDAIARARETGQIAIYSFENGEEIRLDEYVAA
jgi:hypothetical protein